MMFNGKTITADCWTVQFEGISACETCEAKGTDECGGGETLQNLIKDSKITEEIT